MIFTSFEFIAFFLIVLIGYYLIFPNLRWIWLLAASFYFYTKASPQFLPYILASVAVIYASSRMIGYLDSRKASYFQKTSAARETRKYSVRQELSSMWECSPSQSISILLERAFQPLQEVHLPRLISSSLLEFPFTLSNLRGISSMYTAECMSRRKIR